MTHCISCSTCHSLYQRSGTLSGSFFVSVLLLLTVIVALASPALAAPSPELSTEQNIPDLLILVWVNQQMDRVTFVYSKVVKRSDVEAQLGNLLRETGWTADNISVEDVTSGGYASTTVEFCTLGTVNLSSGGFPIEPIVKAFRDEHYIELQFIINMPFEFRGLQRYEDKHIKISLRRGSNDYGYSIFIKDPDFKTLNLPLVQTETATHQPSGANHARAVAFVLIIVLGFLVALLAYFITKRASGSGSEN